MRLYRLTQGRLLLGLFLRVLFGKVPADEATTYGSNHGMMAGVMTGDAANDRALDATGGVGRSDRGERQRGAQEDKPGATCFHVSMTRVWMGAGRCACERITLQRRMMNSGSQYKRRTLQRVQQQYEIGNAALRQPGCKLWSETRPARGRQHD